MPDPMLADDLVVLRGAEHAGLRVSLPGIMSGLRQYHLFAVEARLLDIHRAVERRVFLARDALAGVQHRIEGFARMVGKPSAAGELLCMQPLIEQEIKRWAQAHGLLQSG